MAEINPVRFIEDLSRILQQYQHIYLQDEASNDGVVAWRLEVVHFLKVWKRLATPCRYYRAWDVSVRIVPSSCRVDGIYMLVFGVYLLPHKSIVTGIIA